MVFIMIVQETKNMREIESVILDDEIYNRINCDGFDRELPTDAKYIGCYVAGKIVGVGMYHYVNNLNICHMHILKDYRKSIGLEFGREALKHSPERMVYTNIPEVFPRIMKYVEKLGFKYVDKAKGAIKKNGVEMDVYVYELDLSEVS